MKKMIPALGGVLFGMVLLLPVGTLLSGCFGYRFELSGVTAVAAAVVAVCLTIWLIVLSGREEEPIESGAVKVLLALLAPLSLINAAFAIFVCREICEILSAFVCAGCCLVLTIEYGKPTALKIIALVLSAVMAVPVGFLGFFALFFGNVAQNTIVKSVESPNGAYYAQVVDSDQGALGGDTLVDVFEKKQINLLAFKLYKEPQRVYSGDWGEFYDMEIHWKGDHCLVINGAQYEIK